MYPVTVLLNVLGQLLMFLWDFVLLFQIVLMYVCIMLYYWANKMMMMIRFGKKIGKTFGFIHAPIRGRLLHAKFHPL